MEYIYIGCLITGIIVITLSALWQYSHSGLYPYLSHKKILVNMIIGLLALAEDIITGKASEHFDLEDNVTVTVLYQLEE